ncbi:TPA: phosphate acetyltransferase, partial [Campylobacter upsaliensis]|nr:phosphate acetyltransferase [Campylobacter upsaliensis]
MANLYLMRSKSDDLNTLITKKLLANYTKHYKNVAIYCPVIYVHRIAAVQEWLEEFNIKQSSKESYGFTLRDAM